MTKMTRLSGILQVGLIGAVMLPLWSPAYAESEMEARLREALRNATLQTRQLENEVASMQGRVAELEAENEKLKKLTGGVSAEKAKADREAYEDAVDEFNKRLTAQRDQIAKWQAAYNEAAQAAQATEEARARLASRSAELEERTASCEAKNAKLFDTAEEILAHLEGVSFGDVLLKEEPFTGLARVELQNELQDYEDQILDNKVLQQ
ncbi:hypothetical protein ACSHT0_16060 [Tepidicaulis sp. LMO-SS28]|uniref:hypothetical protein n=1 Tax=Tepidicaulis sp. LMO-SS28 TaxID=3447455 RepID=UPI003EE180C9